MSVMKKIIFVLLLISIVSVPLQVSAAQPIKVFVQDEQVQYDQAPVMQKGRVLVPFRNTAEDMGIDVNWNQKKQQITATYADKTVILTIKSEVALVNKTKVKLDVPAQVIHNRTLIPLRFLSEAFGAKVKWDKITQTVSIAIWEPVRHHFAKVDAEGAILTTYKDQATFEKAMEYINPDEEYMETTVWVNLMDNTAQGITSDHQAVRKVNEKDALLFMHTDSEAYNGETVANGDGFVQVYDEAGTMQKEFEVTVKNIDFTENFKYTTAIALQDAAAVSASK
jgi:hypothetical protein